jgi:dTDP-4-amino-4,6-dideoxygalactose transaminase
MFFAILAPGNKRDKIMRSLFRANISSRITFPPTHLNKWHKGKFEVGKLANTEELGKRILSVPLGNKITISQVERVVLALKKALK